MRFLPCAIAALLIAGCLFVALPAIQAQGDDHFVYPLDDTYIHMGMAKNLATHGVWGVNRHHFSSSSSSPLWTLLLAGAYLVTGVREATPLALNLLFAGLLLWVSDRLLRRLGLPLAARIVALAGLVLAAELPSVVLMGMEHVLHLFLTVAFAERAIHALQSPDAVTRREWGVLCLAGALLGASRYEGFFLVGVVCLLLACRRRLPAGIALGATAIVPLIVLGLISVANGSMFLPNSLLLKAGGEQSSGLAVLFKLPGAEALELFSRHPALLVVFVAGVIATIVAAVRLRSVWHAQVLAPLMLVAMTALHAHFAFSSLFWVYRYDAYLIGFGVVAMGAAASSLPSRIGGPATAAALAVFLFAIASPRRALYPEPEITAARENFLEHVRAADFVNRYYPAGPVVVNDIGALSYFGDALFLDMFGLGDVEPLKIRRANHGAYTAADVEQWTRPFHPSAAIVQLGWAWVPERVPASWTKVAEIEIVRSRQVLGFYAMSPDSAIALRDHVREYYAPLEGGDRYAMRLF
ncbi:MAG TPA: hypothetical protein VNT81_07170 [Vicinamibacterales bacterium]|nr:hypothetical protein [Vicinamibacterales bacterium]